MTSNFKRWLSALLALLMVMTPITASLAEDGVQESMEIEEPTPVEIAPEPEPVQSEVISETEELIPEEEMQPVEDSEGVVESTEPTESIEEELSDADAHEEAPGEEDRESQEQEPSEDEAAPEEEEQPLLVAEPVYATYLDASGVISPVYVSYGTQESELPLPSELPAEFSDGSAEVVPVTWFCTGNTCDGQGYIPECEDREVVFYFQATPVGIPCSPSMLLPAVTVMYEPLPEPAAIDHEGISFAGTDMLIADGATVSIDDILNETGYDPSYRVVNEGGTIVAGDSGAALENPVRLANGGAIKGGTYTGDIEIAGGSITDGSFSGRIECERGNLNGGVFYGSIGGPGRQIYAIINGGTFYGDIGDSEYDGYIFIHGGDFYCNIKCRNLITDGDSTFYNADGEGGERRTVTLGTVGNIAGGTFYADVLNRSNITGGVFYGKVTNGGSKTNCNVLGGDFYGEFDNSVGGKVFTYGTYGGARFLDKASMTNRTVLDAGDDIYFSDEMVITNESVGVIESGNYPCKVINYGTIAGGSFAGGVINMGTICGGALNGEIFNEGGTIAGAKINGMLMSNTGLVKIDGLDVKKDAKTVTISAGKKISIKELLQQLDGENASAYTIKNEGTITGDADDVLLCDFDKTSLGTIEGGTFSGRVFAGTITGGTFNAETHATNIEGGVFNGDVGSTTNKPETILNGTFTDTVCAAVIRGGTFNGNVTAQTISDGEFGGSVTVSDSASVNDNITGGTYSGRVNVKGDISNATFTETSVVTAGTITSGTFWGKVTSIGRKLAGVMTIYGGSFTGSVATEGGNGKTDGASIYGGTFDCNVGTKFSEEQYDGSIFIHKPKTDGTPDPVFTGDYVGGHNVTIECGNFSENTKVIMYSSGVLVDGEFHGPVVCHNAILGGNYYGDVTVNAKPNGQIHGGIFHGTVHNKEGAYISAKGYGDNPPPQFLDGTLENEGVMDPGDGAEFGEEVNIVNQATGSIRSGVYNSPVSNYGAISGGVFKAPVTTYRSIAASQAMFASALMNVPAKTLDIPKGKTMSIDEITAMEGYDASVRIINRGTITGDGELPNPITLIASYESGEGEERKAVKNGVIASGTFTGNIYSFYGMITGGTFEGDILPTRISAEEYDKSLQGNNPGETLVITIAGGTFSGSVGEKGTGHVTVIGSDDSAPVFNGPVAARNLNITGGTFNKEVEVSTVGTIRDGKFYGPVTCNNAILGGEFHNEVTVTSAPNGQIFGGVFYGKVNNKDNAVIGRDSYDDGESQYGPPEFLDGEIDNQSTMDPGAEAIFAEPVMVVNQKSGNILSGVYRGPVRNYGTISNAVFYGDVENEGMIVNSIVLGSISGDGVVLVTGVELNEDGIIVVEENKTVQASAIKSLIGDRSESGMIVINKGTIVDDTNTTTLDCTIIGGANKSGGGGIITGGKYTGTVYAKTIKGGTFSGEVHNLCRETYEKLPAKAQRAAQEVFEIGDLRGSDVNNAAVLYGLAINGGTFTGKIGDDGMNEAIFLRGGNFSGCKGIKAYNLTVSNNPTFGADCSVDFIVGNIAGGTFAGAVKNNNNITAGTFNGTVTNNGTIFGGTFKGGIENNGTISGGETHITNWEFDDAEKKWKQTEPHEQPVAESDVILACAVTNNPGGVIKGTVKTEDGYSLVDKGGRAEASALIATPKGTSKIYSGEQIVCGAPVLDTLSAIDEAEHLTSEWSYLSGAVISPSATISADATKNAFLRTVTWNVQGGELQLGMDWSEATEVPDAEYSSVRILEGATVSGGVWNVPVINEGAITGGTFNQALTNRGSVSGATINGAVTAEAGKIEGCNFGASASVAKVAEGASVNATINVNGRDRAAAYGAKALDVLNAIETRSGYEWRSIGGAEKAVEATDTIPLSGGRYELKKRPVPEIIWPTASPIGVDAPLSSSVLTSADENGTFRWKYPTSTERSAGTKQSAVIFTPNKDNPYNYSGIETTKLIPVEIRNDIITIDVSSGVHYKYYSNDDPTNLSVKVTGFRSATDKSKLQYRFVRDPGEDVGTYALKVEVTSQPANYTFNIIPGTFEIRPKEIQGDFFRVTMKGASYTGEELSPVPEVKDLLENRELEYGKDFTVTFDKLVLESGEYGFAVNGIGNYTGSKRGSLSVGLGNAVIAIQSYTKTYGDPDPEFESTCTGVSEKAGLQYELYRIEGEKVGTYSILARKLAGDSVAINQQGGGTLKIVPKQLPATITAPGEQPYNGKPIEPKVVVTDQIWGGEATLVEGKDYTLSYENNVQFGTATVVVTGKGNYTGEQRVNFTIGKGKATLTIDSLSKSINGRDPQFTAQVTGLAAGDKLNYTLVCEHPEQVGSYDITAVLGDNPNYDVTVIPGKLEINLNPEQVELSEEKLELMAGESGELSFKLLPEGTQSTVTYRSSDVKVASVNAETGHIETLKPGVVTITATTANGKTDSCALTVRPVPEDFAIGNGDTQTLVPSDASVKNYTFASSNTAIASVDAKGVVTAKKEGDVTITASSGGVALSEWDVDVTEKPDKVTLSAASATIGTNEKLDLDATVNNGAPSDIAWTTSSSKIATVDAEGNITVKKTGTVTITAATYNKVKATCKLTIKAPATSIALNVTNAELGCGEALPLTATLGPKNTASTITYTSTNDAIAKVVDGKIVAGNQRGNATITAAIANGKTATCTVKVVEEPKSISLGEDVALPVGKTMELAPVVSPAGAKSAVEYSTSNKKLVTVTAQGVVKAVKAGTATITAKSYNGVEDSMQVTVVAAPSKVTMSASKASIGAGETYDLSATVTGGLNETIKWTSSNEKIATVADGVVTAVKAGSATITAATYNNKKATCKITVTAAPDSVTLSVTEAELGCGESLALKATLAPKNSVSAITYTSTDEDVAKVVDGKIVAGSETGSATITATTYNGKTATCSVNVVRAPESISLGGDVKLVVGKTLALNPAIEPSGAKSAVTYSTSNKKLATVTADGVVKAVKAGTVTITAKSYNDVSGSVQITVVGAPSKVTMSASKASLGVGETYQLSTTVTGGIDEMVTWSTSNKNIATVDESGKVTIGEKTGSVTITAATYNNKKATCKITVSAAPTSIALNLSDVVMGIGETPKALTATLSKKTASTITYDYDDSVISLEKGKIVPKAPGTTTIKASTFNGLSAECKVTVYAAPTSVELGEDQGLKVKETLTLQPKFGSGEGGTVTYKTSNKNVATVDATGKVTAKKAGTAVITVTTYNKKTDTVTITVTK